MVIKMIDKAHPHKLVVFDWYMISKIRYVTIHTYAIVFTTKRNIYFYACFLVCSYVFLMKKYSKLIVTFRY